MPKIKAPSQMADANGAVKAAYRTPFVLDHLARAARAGVPPEALAWNGDGDDNWYIILVIKLSRIGKEAAPKSADRWAIVDEAYDTQETLYRGLDLYCGIDVAEADALQLVPRTAQFLELRAMAFDNALPRGRRRPKGEILRPMTRRQRAVSVVPPLIMTPVPAADVARGDGPFVSEFIQGTAGHPGYCRVTKESFGGSAGDLIRLRGWQHEVGGRVFARRPDGRYRHREALIGLPRKQGKSALGSSYGLHGLVFGSPGSETYSAAADKEQARIVFGVAKRMVEMDHQLSDVIHVYKDALEYTSTGSIYKVLSSEAFTKEGLNPSVIIYDELHAAPTDELYNVLAQAQGARIDPLFIIITTAGVKTDQTGQDSICYRRYQYGEKVASGEIDDPTFFMAWWGAPVGADYKDPAVWAAANPGFGDLINPEDFTSVLGKVHENDFRTKRLNQWVSQVHAWLPQGAWRACQSNREFLPGSDGVVLGFDGSRSGDCTALVAVTVEPEPVVRVLNLWERPQGAQDWKVPRSEVKDAIRLACRDYSVREIAADEYIWSDALEDLEDEGLPVVVFPQTLTKMGPATQRFYEMAVHRKLAHDGDQRLARHLDNAKLKTDSRGARLMKDAHNSPRKIDLAVAAVMAVDRAAFYLHEPGPDCYIWKDSSGRERSKPISEIGFVY